MSDHRQKPGIGSAAEFIAGGSLVLSAILLQIADTYERIGGILPFVGKYPFLIIAVFVLIHALWSYWKRSQAINKIWEEFQEYEREDDRSRQNISNEITDIKASMKVAEGQVNMLLFQGMMMSKERGVAIIKSGPTTPEERAKLMGELTNSMQALKDIYDEGEKRFGGGASGEGPREELQRGSGPAGAPEEKKEG